MDRDSELKELSYHAAGDIVVSYLLGYKIEDVQIGYSEREGRDFSASLEGPEDPSLDAMTYVASYIAEQIFTGSSEELDLEELSDWADAPVTETIISDCRKMLIENWSAVEALAAALYREGLLDGNRATEIIRSGITSIIF